MGRAKNDSETPILAALEAAEPKPPVSGKRPDKKNYAERLSRALAVTVARGLRPSFPTVHPTEDEVGHEMAFAVGGGRKRLDVSVWSERDKAGLVLDVSIKTYSFQDWDSKKKRAGRMTKNVVRNDHELRAEAAKVHARQPWAVLVGVMFTPVEACDDGKTDHSSFAHMVLTFRGRTGRSGPDDPRYELFEAFYVALYHQDGDSRGAVRFFDVATNPPRQGRPQLKDTVSFGEWCAEVDRLVRERSSPRQQWAEPGDDF